MAVSHSPPIESHLHAVEQRMVDLFALRRRVLPQGLETGTGRWKDAPVAIATRAYEGDAVSYLRVALVSGIQVTLGSILALPRPNRPVPILGAELSWSGARGELTVTADLTPVRDALERHTELAAIARGVPDVSRLPTAGELPRWRTEWSSPSALHTRVARGQAGEALKAFDGYVNAFVKLLGGTSPSAERAYHIRAMQEGYILAHRDDESLAILGAMFGRAWTENYLARAFFPVS
jgi:hypothetical protein